MKSTQRRWVALAAAGLSLIAAGVPGCRSAYYRTMEAFGSEKRDILADRVEDARDEQAEAKEEFASALEQFLALVRLEDTELREAYDRASASLKRSESQAKDVRERIDAVEDVAEDLFDEWEDELDEYTSPDLRRRSEARLDETRRRYGELIGAMRRAESRMEPVLAAFRDQVLFLKHNLNAQAVASLRGEAAGLEQDIARLIAEMEAAIAEADRFVSELQKGG